MTNTQHTDPIERDTLEELAAIEHERWSHWQAWCHKVLRDNCPSPELEKVLERWDKQIATPYAELSEAEKQSDRDQVKRYMHVLTRIQQETERRVREEAVARYQTEYEQKHIASAVEIARKEEREKIVEWIKQHSKFANPQKPQDDSDERWEIHYAGYREAVKDLITHLTT